MCEERGNKVHNKRPLLLQLGPNHQRGRCRRRPRRIHQRLSHRLASHVAQLGPKLAEQRLPQRSIPLLPSHHQRWSHYHQLQRRSFRLAVRPNLRRCPVLVLWHFVEHLMGITLRLLSLFSTRSSLPFFYYYYY